MWMEFDASSYQNCFKTLFRMFWTLCLVFSLLYCGITSYEMYEKLEQATVAITYDSDERSVENVGCLIVFHLKTLFKKILKLQIPFPAVFISPEVWLPEVIVKTAWTILNMGFSEKDQFFYLRQFGMFNR